MGVRTEIGAVTVLAFEMRYPSGAPSLALRLTCECKVVIDTGDTEWVEAIVEAGRDADLLIAQRYRVAQAIPIHLD